MNPVTLTIICRFIGMLAFIAVGLVAIVFGYKLFAAGSDSKNAKIIVKIREFQVTAHSVGPVIMATAVAWGYFGYSVSPNLKTSNNSTEVASGAAFGSPVQFDTKLGTVSVPTIFTTEKLLGVGRSTSGSNGTLTLDYERLAAQDIASQIAKLQSKTNGSHSSAPAAGVVFDPDKVKLYSNEKGELQLSAAGTANGRAVGVRYDSVEGKHGRVFFPREVTVSPSDVSNTGYKPPASSSPAP